MTTTTNRTWDLTQPWPTEPRIVLQASAGTGKTYQIAAVVTRLVAEGKAPIDKLLVMTFTNAAATELRDRIRSRMQGALTALALPPPAADGDKLHAHLRQFSPQAGQWLALALADFDRAAISTIHAFCQKTLQQFAFESQQDFDLQLLTDPAPLRDQQVADALANIYAQCSVDQIAVAEDMGWKREHLAEVVKAMTAVAEPSVSPPLPQALADAVRQGRPGWRVALDAIVAYHQLVTDLCGWLDSAAGQAAVEAFQLERDQPQYRDSKGKPVVRISADVLGSAIRNVKWMRGNAPWSTRPTGPKPVDWLRFTKFAEPETWKGTGRPQDQFAGWPLIERYEKFLSDAEPLATVPLAAFATDVRARFEGEIARQALQTYDGMIANLADRLRHEAQQSASNRPLTKALREQFMVGLVDEFQDTDAAQWSILSHIFGDAPKHQLFLIGDPKQSIYSFRNADIAVYLAATEPARSFELNVNYRSDGPLVEACNEVWLHSAAPFGAQTGIAYTKVLAKHSTARLIGLNDAALHLRWIAAAPGETAMTKELGKRLSAQLCAQECRALLTATPVVKPDNERPEVRLLPGHIAVLVHTHGQGRLVQAALAELQIPAVSAARGSIFKSDVGPWLCAFLDAVTDPTDEGACRRWAVTPLVGWSAVQLAQAIALQDAPTAQVMPQAPNADWAVLRKEVATAAFYWPAHGFTRVLEAALAAHDAMARLLGSPYGERAATDLRHLIELCHAEERRVHASPRGLAQWLRQQAARPAEANDEQSQRLQSDDDAVQVVTIHSCKGLQYPVALLPFAWWYDEARDNAKPFLAPSLDGQRQLCVAAKGSPLRDDAKSRHDEALVAEKVRLLYVAMTRAQHRCVVWLYPAKGYQLSAAMRLMRRAQPEASEPATPVAVFAQHPYIAIDNACQPDTQTGPWQRPQPPPVVFAPTALAKPWAMGQRWQVPSYTGLTKNLHLDNVQTEERSARDLLEPPERPREDDDEDAEPSQPPFDDIAKRIANEQFVAQFAASHQHYFVPVPGAVLIKGKRAGNWLHKVMEDLQFAPNADGKIVAKDGRSALDLIKAQGIRHGYKLPEQHQAMEQLLPAWLDTPLGIRAAAQPAADELTLRKLAPLHRIDELEFDLRLASGAWFSRQQRKEPGQLVNPAAIRLALIDATEDNPQAKAFRGRGWLEAYLQEKTKADQERKFVGEIAGLLNGKIDLLLRHNDRYYIADYKGNWIKGADAHQNLIPHSARFDAKGRPALLQEHYTQPAMLWAMGDHAYHLQALIYAVAVHRLLAQRMGSQYHIDAHLGGHRYLFVRGMLGPTTPIDGDTVLGVFADRWPSRTVVGLSAALSGCDETAVQVAMQTLVDPTFGGTP